MRDSEDLNNGLFYSCIQIVSPFVEWSIFGMAFENQTILSGFYKFLYYMNGLTNQLNIQKLNKLTSEFRMCSVFSYPLFR